MDIRRSTEKIKTQYTLREDCLDNILKEKLSRKSSWHKRGYLRQVDIRPDIEKSAIAQRNKRNK